MLNARSDGDWDAAGLNAIHCAISACDAVVVALAGKRSSSKDHSDASRLLAKTVGDAEARQARRHLDMLIAKKNLVEYEGRILTKSEAEIAVKHAERFLEWAIDQMPAEYLPPKRP